MSSILYEKTTKRKDLIYTELNLKVSKFCCTVSFMIYFPVKDCDAAEGLKKEASRRGYQPSVLHTRSSHSTHEHMYIHIYIIFRTYIFRKVYEIMYIQVGIHVQAVPKLAP